MLGAIIGDIVGSVYEFRNHRSKVFEPFFHPNAFYTDDTVCTVAVADALVNDRHPAQALKDWGRRYWNNGGWGQRFAMWLASDALDPYGSFGNGAAMRVAPAGLLANSVDEAISMARKVTEVTHDHPAGLPLQRNLPGNRTAGAGLRAHRNELRGRDSQCDLNRGRQRHRGRHCGWGGGGDVRRTQRCGRPGLELPAGRHARGAEGAISPKWRGSMSSSAARLAWCPGAPHIQHSSPRSEQIMKGLVIRSPWIDHILAGNKTWEMRTRATSIRGRIALIKAGSGLIYGTAELVECKPSLDLEQLRATQAFHAIPVSGIEDAFANRWTTPWVLRDVRRFARPVPYTHPSGAVTWVDLPTFQAEPGWTDATPSVTVKEPPPARQPPSTGEHRRPQHRAEGPWVDIRLTEGNLRNNHFYLRTAESLLPSDCIGGSNKSDLGRAIRVTFEPGPSIECDVAGDKMILRARAQVRDFFERSGSRAGDTLRFMRVGERDFLVRRSEPV